ncbi:NADH-ubiquinone oxidoreductase-F iron-sulfur binding region domain-containing protein [Nocardioides sp.]|uniref:NADH-ubiquinone oxidoreductase-F iron-sulfur binding region domain-containing protein n=1 Tax=Nocardioides sp. TaxID=35761 RepID=UPI0035140CA8
MTAPASERDILAHAGASPISIEHHPRIEPGPALLRHTTHAHDLRAHRLRHGEPPELDLASLHAMAGAAAVQGRGGAGFPFARKLRTAAEHARRGRRPIVVVNASEGEPASAKDAALAEVAPHLVLDGAAVAARALGAREVHVVLPGDRPRASGLLATAVGERTDARLTWRVHDAPARFVAGQARAVLELMAGRPGLPVTAWAPEAVSGHRGRPTLLSNAETWAHIGLLALEGIRPTLERGTRDEPGTTLLTLHAAGTPVTVVEVEHGTPLAPLLPALAWDAPVLIGGFHGTWTTSAALAGAHLSRAELRERGVGLGAGVIIAPGPDACPLGLTAAIVEHLAAESAGRCGPCVNGLPALARAVRGVVHGVVGAREEAARLSGLVTGRGACAHPDGTARLVASALTALAGEVAAHADGGCGAGAAQEVAS